MFRVYVTFSYVLLLHGAEDFMLNMTTIKKNMDESLDYILIELKGKVKGESHERYHIFP